MVSLSMDIIAQKHDSFVLLRLRLRQGILRSSP